jgi:hypothetical protein
MGPVGNMTEFAPRLYEWAGMNMGVHSDEGSGVTSLRGINPL